MTQQSVYTLLDEYMMQKTNYESQREMYINSLEEYAIKAKVSGVVHLSTGLVEGTVLQAGVLLGNIESGNSEALIFDCMVGASERSKLDVNCNVEIGISGVSQYEYGVLLGEIVSIDNDSTQMEDGQVVYFLRVKPSSTCLQDKKGNKVSLHVGMIGEVRIKNELSSWMQWIIEQIGIKFR